MAILMTHFWPGATERQYREEIAGVHPNDGRDLPAGQIFHAAGPAPGGFLISVFGGSRVLPQLLGFIATVRADVARRENLAVAVRADLSDQPVALFFESPVSWDFHK